MGPRWSGSKKLWQLKRKRTIAAFFSHYAWFSSLRTSVSARYSSSPPAAATSEPHQVRECGEAAGNRDILVCAESWLVKKCYSEHFYCADEDKIFLAHFQIVKKPEMAIIWEHIFFWPKIAIIRTVSTLTSVFKNPSGTYPAQFI